MSSRSPFNSYDNRFGIPRIMFGPGSRASSGSIDCSPNEECPSSPIIDSDSDSNNSIQKSRSRDREDFSLPPDSVGHDFRALTPSRQSCISPAFERISLVHLEVFSRTDCFARLRDRTELYSFDVRAFSHREEEKGIEGGGGAADQDGSRTSENSSDSEPIEDDFNPDALVPARHLTAELVREWQKRMRNPK